MNSESAIDISAIDTAVHGPVRLGVLVALQAEGALGFTNLKKRLGVGDGAIGMHLQKLEEIGYVAVTKGFVVRRPRTSYAMTRRGRVALFGYFQIMQKLIDSLAMEDPDKPTENTPS